MTTDFMARIKRSFGSDSSRPKLPLACPSRSSSGPSLENIRLQPRVHFKGSSRRS
ncbi:hypothetical protein E4U54_005415, partial [Claviceps lovelessii]